MPLSLGHLTSPRLLAVVLLLTCPAGGTARSLSALRGSLANEASSHTRLSEAAGEFLEQQDGKETPIQRVVKLLQEMKAQLEKEMAAESEMYDKMVCWCETNNKEKTQAIAEADASIGELESEVAERSGRGAELATKIGALKVDLAEKKASLKKATTLREKEHADFDAAENDLVEAVSMLKNAIVVLSRHNDGTSTGLLQMEPAVKESLGAALRWVALKHEELLELRAEASASGAGPGEVRAHAQAPRASLLSLAAASAGASAAEREAWGELVGERGQRRSGLPVAFAARVLAGRAAGAPSLVQQPANFQSYAPQSGQIFGVLKQMQEDFEGDLSKAQEAELKAREMFGQLKASLEEQISTSTTKLDELEGDASANAKSLSDAKEDLATTRETRAADVKFLSNLRLECQDLDHDWKQRSAARGEEIKAVAEAMSILTEDDARTLFHKKMGAAAFVQVSASSSAASVASAARGRAAEALREAGRALAARLGSAAGRGAFARREYSPEEQLAAIALQVQLDSFAKVKEAIDTMVADLRSQQDKEVKHKAFCTDGLNDNEKETYAVNETLSDLSDHIGELGDTIEKLTTEIKAAQGAISNAEVEIKRASEMRREESKDFQEEVMDQRAVQQILQKAIARMKMVYKGKALVQKSRQEPPIKFQPFKQNAGGSPVISLMEQIVEDAKGLEKEAQNAEQAAQTAYAEYINDSYAAIKALKEAIETKRKAKAQTEADKAEKEAEHKSTEERLEGLVEVAADLHQQCDFVLKNFDIRQTARTQEIEALGQVKAMLSGMQGK